MWEKILIGLVGAALALGIKEVIDRRKLVAKGRLIASLSVKHLEILKKDLVEHVKVDGGNAFFGETQYCEVSVADFLYAHITTNIQCFESINAVEKTISFFHRYKVNMATVKTRLDSSKETTVSLRQDTFEKLVAALEEALVELREIAK